MIDLWPKVLQQKQVEHITVALKVHGHLCGSVDAHAIEIDHSLDAVIIFHLFVIVNNLNLILNA